jgi:hypothetical protein
MKNVLFFLLLSLAVHGQPQFEWLDRFDATGNDNALIVDVDSYGNVYNLGLFTGTTDFDPSASVYTLSQVGYNTGYLSKMDKNGSLNWAIKLPGTTRSMCLDKAGSVYICGYFSSVTDLDPGPAVQSFTAAWGAGDAYVLKLDDHGNFLWARQFKSSSTSDPRAIFADQDGFIYVTGMFQGTVDFDPGPAAFSLFQGGSVYSASFICKLDLNGNFVWARKFGGPRSSVWGEDIVVDPLGNVYATGAYADTVDFDPGPGTFYLSAGQFETYVSKLDKFGNFIWAGQLGGSGADFGQSIRLDRRKNIYVLAHGWACDADPGPGIYTINGGSFISKLDSTGNFMSAIGPLGNSINAFALDAFDNLYVAGLYNDTVDFDPGLNTFTLPAAPDNQIYLRKSDMNGAFVWAGNIGGGKLMGNGIHVAGSQDIYLTGQCSGSNDFDPGPKVHSVLSGTTSNCFVLKINEFVPVTTSSQTFQRSLITIAPNPTKGIIRIDADLPFQHPLMVHDITGKEVYHDAVFTSAAELDLGFLNNGVYILSAGSERKRIIICK